MQATMKYKSALEGSEKRAKAAQLKMNEAKQHTQKYLALAKQSQREAMVAIAALKKKKTADEAKLKPGGGGDGQMAGRVKDTIAAFALTAEKRREQLNQKRTAYTSSTWLQSLPRVSLPLRKSLWHKMHRRRQQIVLRPSPESLTNELRRSVRKQLEKSEDWNARDKKSMEAELEKAEQAFYLAAHPVLPLGETVSAVPSSSAWAEPGKSKMLCLAKPRCIDSVDSYTKSFQVTIWISLFQRFSQVFFLALLPHRSFCAIYRNCTRLRVDKQRISFGQRI